MNILTSGEVRRVFERLAEDKREQYYAAENEIDTRVLDAQIELLEEIAGAFS